MKHMHAGNAIRRTGMVLATAATISFLTTLPLVSLAQKQDKNAKQQAQSQSDSAIVNGAMKKYADAVLQRNILVSFTPAFSTNAIFNSAEYVPVTDPKTDNTVVKLSPGEQNNLRNSGMIKPMGRPYLLVFVKGADGAADKVYVFELKHTDIQQAKPDSGITQ